VEHTQKHLLTRLHQDFCVLHNYADGHSGEIWGTATILHGNTPECVYAVLAIGLLTAMRRVYPGHSVLSLAIFERG
jgi:hypothetical protein